jgi:hypothetical protein
MLISRPEESRIDAQNPFIDDALQRGALAKPFTDLLLRLKGPLTVALSGEFGTGKTFFLSRCRQLLENQGASVVMLNAWETDFAAEPMAPLVTAITTGFAAVSKVPQKLMANIKKGAAFIASAAIPLSVKLITAGVLKMEDLSEGAIADAAEKLAKEQFDRFFANKNAIHKLRDDLAAFARAVAEKANGPLILLVDELDRCRPTYAIEFLEIVKHLFNVPGVVFVLGIDVRQLASSARAVFGQALDGDAYLRRFIDFECALPAPRVARYFLTHGPSLIKTTTGLDLPRDSQIILEGLGRLCEEARFSLRKANQFLTRLGILLALAESSLYPEVVALLAFVREFDIDLYRAYATRKTSTWDLYLRLQKDVHSGFLAREYSGEPVFLWAMCMMGRGDLPQPFHVRFADALTVDDKASYVENLTKKIERSGFNSQVMQHSLGTIDFAAAMVVR